MKSNRKPSDNHLAKNRIRRLTSAGGLVYLKNGSDILLVLCGRNKPRVWNLPKGTPNTGENRRQTALREVREETGLDVSIQSPIDKIQYWFSYPGNSTKFHKTVYFYLMRYHGGSTDQHDIEFDEVRWFSPDEAVNCITFENELKILELGIEMIKRDPVI